MIGRLEGLQNAIGDNGAFLLAYVAIFIVFALIFLREVIAPASGNICDKRWRIYAGVLTIAQFVVAIACGYMFRSFFENHALLPLQQSLPAPAQAFIVFLTASFVAYWWHRLEHQSDFLWRAFHQLHHSPRRIESLTSFYVHPLDGLAAIFLNCAVAYLIFGASAPVAALAIAIAAIYNIAIHTDAHSPRWLGVFIQRPEMHRIHHRSNHHADNYGLPIWDLLFGTFKNPVDASFPCGFDAEKETRISDMLLMKDVKG